MCRPLLKLRKVPSHPGSESVMSFSMFVMETQLDTPATKCLLVRFTVLLTRSHLNTHLVNDKQILTITFLFFVLEEGEEGKMIKVLVFLREGNKASHIEC